MSPYEARTKQESQAEKKECFIEETKHIYRNLPGARVKDPSSHHLALLQRKTLTNTYIPQSKIWKLKWKRSFRGMKEMESHHQGIRGRFRMAAVRQAHTEEEQCTDRMR